MKTTILTLLLTISILSGCGSSTETTETTTTLLEQDTNVDLSLFSSALQNMNETEVSDFQMSLSGGAYTANLNGTYDWKNGLGTTNVNVFTLNGEKGDDLKAWWSTPGAFLLSNPPNLELLTDKEWIATALDAEQGTLQRTLIILSSLTTATSEDIQSSTYEGTDNKGHIFKYNSFRYWIKDNNLTKFEVKTGGELGNIQILLESSIHDGFAVQTETTDLKNPIKLPDETTIINESALTIEERATLYNR